ncbi:hypothetical protein PG1C_13915 [Rugosibacter aromaticivorans]|uniref:Uncharacterized protein n=1 Tax=Rugosibacter aromaticivorans TaxID=1565605 RepID=A0A0C5JBV2_9PROT|nr:hypothetical protein [Rugosibacter aromaticivorans]AJP49229.1 hypothetical protein PG1C_13915 [Rugosibacter aromaticivorans]TBR14518.1 MAG: hypothetical protein EPO43_07255 [Rugosibacter sp.]
MTSYKYFVSPLGVMIGGAVIATILATLVVERMRNKQKGRQKAELSGWESEGGSVAATNVVAP